tara:strand:+ start:120 stop:272 length:153 start_codon:yes stop_codon:yes gene_type:complete
MNDYDLLRILENIGMEQVLLDAQMTMEDVFLLLHDLKYIDLEIYDLYEEE